MPRPVFASRRELCLANLTLPDANPVELVAAAADAGFDSVNLWLVPPFAVGLLAGAVRERPPLVGDRRALGALRAHLDARNVRVFAGSAAWITADFDRATLAPVLDALVMLGARGVAVVGWDDERERLAFNLAAICEEALQRELRVHLEFMPYTAVRTPADAAALLRKIRYPNAALIVDALHLARGGGTPADLVGLGVPIASVQLCDAPAQAPPVAELRRESVTARRYPGDGALPLRELLAVLPADAVVEAEVPVARDAHLSRTERARRAADATRRVLSAVPSRPTG